MKYAVFMPQQNREHQLVLSAFYRGMQRIENGVVKIMDIEKYDPLYDAAVIFGVGKKGVPISYPRGRVIQLQTEAKKDTVVLEKGYINRHEYYAVGLNGLNNRAEFNNKDRPFMRFKQLNIDVNPWRRNGDHIVLMGQVPSDASVQNIDILQWCDQTVQELTKHTDRTIIYRPHPLAISRSRSIPNTVYSMRTLDEDLKNAWAVVSYNSNSAVDAAIKGIPVFVDDAGSMALDIANRDISLIEKPVMPQRDKWLYNLAYAQWNLEEMAHGLPWQHIKEILGQL